MLRNLDDDKKVDWRKSLPAAVHAYNCCISESTGFSPYFLFFGRHPRLPVDIAFGIDLDKKGFSSPRQYVKSLKDQLSHAYQNAREHMKKQSAKNKARYDVSAHAAELEPGDRVLVRKLGPRLTSKVADKWEKEIYVVVEKSSDLPVYTVQSEGGNGPKRTLHRNYLLPIGMLDDSFPLPVPKRMTDRDKSRKEMIILSDSNSESEVEPVEIVVTVDQGGLRADAPEFVPLRVLQDVPLENVTDNPFDTDGELSSSDNAEVVGHGLPIVDSLSEDDGDDDMDSESETDSAQSIPVSPVRPTFVSPRPLPRRSLRPLKPVDRLNLLHQLDSIGELKEASRSTSGTPRVSPRTLTKKPIPLPRSVKTLKVENCKLANQSYVQGTCLDISLTGAVVERLNMLMGRTVPKTTAVVIEGLLRRVLSFLTD